MRLVYVSFASPEAFLGAALVEAPDLAGALSRAWRDGFNPGGSVVLVDVTDAPEAHDIDARDRNRLLTLDEAERVFGRLERAS